MEWEVRPRRKGLLYGMGLGWAHGLEVMVTTKSSPDQGLGLRHGIRLGSWFGGDGHGQERS